jgi:hypothetical protein
MVTQIEDQLFTLVERRFAELMGRIDAIAPDARRAKEFRFAAEKSNDGDDAVVDLPNPLGRRLN